MQVRIDGATASLVGGDWAKINTMVISLVTRCLRTAAPRNADTPRLQAFLQTRGIGSRGSGGWIRTTDLRVMSPTSCHCSTPRWWVHGPCLPAGIPPVPSALRRFTTRFGMGRGGSIALLAHHWFRGLQIIDIRSSASLLEPLIFRQGSPRPCARVASTCHHASSSRRSPSYLLGDLPA